MTPPMLPRAALDRAVAEAMGWRLPRADELTCLWIDPSGQKRPEGIPHPSSSWEDFGALLLWCAEKGLSVILHTGPKRTVARLVGGNKMFEDMDADPRVALCMAVAEWHRANKTPPSAGKEE